MRRALCVLMTLCVSTALAATKPEIQGSRAKTVIESSATRIAQSAMVLRELRSAPDKGIPHDLFTKASCVAVVPSLKKAAFIIGGEYGKGVMSCQKAGHWSAPSFIEVGKGSIGAQIGAKTVDLVMLVMSDRGLERLLADKVTLGGEASVAAGPIGRDARAMTDAQLKAEILSYSRARGLFAGMDLTGGIFRPDRDANRELYRRAISAREILVNHSVDVPRAAATFMAALNQTVASN